MVMPREERPPYVQFEQIAVEDRNASIAAGHYVAHDVAHVIITPQGSKDRIVRVAADWLKEKQNDVHSGRFPRRWYDEYKASFEAWLRDEEPPVSGTALRNWPVISPSQYKMLRDLRILCVEDLAASNEETISRIGPGARALKKKAEEWLAQASGLGMQVEEAERLRIDNANLQGQVEAQQLQITELAATVNAMRPAGAVVNSGEFTIS